MTYIIRTQSGHTKAVNRAIRRALERDLKIFFVVAGVEAALALILSLILQIGYLNLLRLILLATGLLILIVSAVEGTGAAEIRLVKSGAYTISPSYQKTVVEGRMARRQEGFWFMIVGFFFGIGFLGIAGVLGLVTSP